MAALSYFDKLRLQQCIFTRWFHNVKKQRLEHSSYLQKLDLLFTKRGDLNQNRAGVVRNLDISMYSRYLEDF